MAKAEGAFDHLRGTATQIRICCNAIKDLGRAKCRCADVQSVECR